MHTTDHIKRNVVKGKLEPLLKQVDQLQSALESLSKQDCSAAWQQQVNAMFETMLQAQQRFYQQLCQQAQPSKSNKLSRQYFYEDWQRALADFEQLKEEQHCKTVKHQILQLKTTIYFKMQMAYQQVV